VIEHCRSVGGVSPEALRGEHCAGGSDERGIDEPSSTTVHCSTAPVGVLALVGGPPCILALLILCGPRENAPRSWSKAS
jgi:hypothetical protein